MRLALEMHSTKFETKDESNKRGGLGAATGYQRGFGFSANCTAFFQKHAFLAYFCLNFC